MKNKHFSTYLSWSIWLIIWQIASMIIQMNIFLPSPIQVSNSLFRLLVLGDFWQSAIFSLSFIFIGFLLSVCVSILLAVIANRFSFIEHFINPFMITVKSVPVASFIILALIWFSSKNLSILISFLMGLPIIYTNTLQGMKSTDKDLLEMAQVFHVTTRKRIKYIYMLEIFPYFRSAISISIGLCFKAGIAAEVIGLPKHSIGENLFQAKIYLNTADLFAWTIVVILLCLGLEKSIMKWLDLLFQKICSD